MASGLRIHARALQLMRSNRPSAVSRREILAFFDFLPTRLSNGFVEGKNNRTKALMCQGYGYRNRRHLRLRILLEVA